MVMDSKLGGYGYFASRLRKQFSSSTGFFLSIHLLPTYFFCSYKEAVLFCDEKLFCGSTNCVLV